MESPFYVGLSRQTALQRELAVIANNVANMNTTGFKKELMVYQTYPTASGPSTKVNYVIDQGTATDRTPGGMQITGNQMDFGLKGPGYFAVDDGTGQRYTRNGTFQLDERNRLVTNLGVPVMDVQDNPIVVPNVGDPIVVTEDGNVRQGTTFIGQLKIVEFDDENALKKWRDSMYDSPNPPRAASKTMVIQGSVETSNVKPIMEMTNMIEVQRAYEAVKSMIDREDERQKNAVERLARPLQG